MRAFHFPLARKLISAFAVVGMLQAGIAVPARSFEASDETKCINSDKDPLEAIQACTRIIASAPDQQKLADTYLNRGRAHYIAGNYTDAKEDFSESANVKPSFQAYQNRGFAKVKLSDLSGALADFNKSIDLSNKPADLYVMRGVVLTSMGEFGRALSDFDRALKIDPKFVGAYYNRAYVLQRTRDRDGAYKDYSQVIKLTPTAARGYIGRASVSLDMAKFAAAIKDLDEAVKLDPKNAEAFSVRGEAKRLSGDLTRALDDASEAVRLAPTSDSVHRNRALIRRDKKDFAAALADLDEALLHNPNSDQALAVRGEIWAMKGDLDQSVADLDKAVAMNPRSPVSLTLRGDTLRLKGELAAALRDYDAANHYVSDYVAAFVGRGLVKESQNDLDGALAEFTKALSLPGEVDVERSKPAREIAQAHIASVREQIALADRKKKEAAEALAASEAAQRKAADAEVQAQALKKAMDEANERVKAEKERLATIERELHQKAEARAKAEQEKIEAANLEIQRRKEALEAERKKIAEQLPEALPDQGKRIALIIGNSAYQAVPQLYNPKRDAELVAETLKSVGFNSVKLVQDMNFAQMRKELRDFQTAADEADWAMIYFAGHGIEVAGTNYLIPVDAHLSSDRDIEDEAVSLKYVLDKIKGARRLHLVVLDACRDNPFENLMRRQTAMRSVTRGLAPFEPQLANEIVLYAAKDGERALDGQNGHSPFATAFVNRISMPRTEINRAFRLITSDVEKATKNAQQPWQYGSTRGEDDFYFNAK